MLTNYAESLSDLVNDLDGDVEECLERAYDTPDEDDEEAISVDLQSSDAGVY